MTADSDQIRSYLALSAKGIEEITAAELSRLGAPEVRRVPGGVYFKGDRALLYRAHLWLRTASRILWPLRDFAAASPEMLYDQVRRLDWGRIFSPTATFAVECKIAGQKHLPGAKRCGRPAPPRPERLQHSHFAALKIKDAIADELRKVRGSRPDVQRQNPDLIIYAFLYGRRCTLSLDASGGSLHQRGYRPAEAEAPLKETLAAAILELAGWDGTSPLLDPMCGSGTLLLEAAIKAMKIAPGLARPRFGFFAWPDFERELWETLGAEARRCRGPAPHLLQGSDRDPEAIGLARAGAARLGAATEISFSVQDLQTLLPPSGPPGLVVVNPPYGERLGQDQDLAALYRTLGDVLKQRFKGWRAAIFTANLEAAKKIGLRATRRIPLYNGPLEGRLLLYDLY